MKARARDGGQAGASGRSVNGGQARASGPPVNGGQARASGPPDPAGFREALLAHFDSGRRALPWRVGRTPYRVMVSEFMLQQTRVETVIPYYERWMRKFPDWESLARATEDEVILEWKGLGYYSRARNLHRTARTVRERYGGHLPPGPAALKTLPGVGDYTAGAVASIAFGEAVPAVDGNVRRVLARLHDIAAPSPARLRREAARLLDHARPGDFNEAMMELGATVCTPRSPRCGECPVAQWCRARLAGTAEERPARRRRTRAPRVAYATAVLVDAAGRTLLVRRPPRGLLAGMWEFPAVRVGGEGGVAARLAGEAIVAAALAVASEHAGARAPAEGAPAASEHAAARAPATSAPAPCHPQPHPLPPVRHAFTHLRATYHPIILPGPFSTQRDDRPPPGIRVHHTRLDEWALPVAQQKIAALLRRWIARRATGGAGRT